MSARPPLTVAMAVHNGMPYVEASVRSILAQSFTDFELVIGDDGSDDGTSDVLRRLASEDRRIRLLRREQPSGLAGSANWVVGEARAPLVAIAHADDISLPHRLERQMAAARAAPDAVLVGTLAAGIDETARRVRPPPSWLMGRAAGPFAPFPHSSSLIRRAAFDAVGGYRHEANYWEDYDLYLRLLPHGRVMVIAEELCWVRHSRSSSRLRGEDVSVYRAVDLMYRTAEALWRSRGVPVPIPDDPPSGKLKPLTFVARGSISLWSGRSPRVLRPMMRHARLRADKETIASLAWALWGEIHPPTLRSAIRSMLRFRNWRARRRLAGQDVIEWHPWETAE